MKEQRAIKKSKVKAKKQNELIKLIKTYNTKNPQIQRTKFLTFNEMQ